MLVIPTVGPPSAASSDASSADRPGPKACWTRASDRAVTRCRTGDSGAGNDTEALGRLSTRSSGRVGDIAGMVPGDAHLSISCDPLRTSRRASAAFVLEPDLQLDPVLGDLAVLDAGGRLHDLDRPDVSNGPGCRSHGLASGIAPGPRARSDHLTNDDHAHRAP